MIFITLDFALFFSIFFILYWFIFHKNIKIQNILILIASYIFYGWWDWRFLILIFISSLVDYLVGRLLMKEDREINRKILLWVSIGTNLGILGFFKYFNFFLDSFKSAYGLFNATAEFSTLDIILPVGISFYTLQTLSYTIDIYDKKIKATNDIVSFFAFVSFFPQLVAGPIERASKLLPQFKKKRIFNYEQAADGMRQVLWGLFKKMVIADNCAKYVNIGFSDYESLDGSTLFLTLVIACFQFYCDFSGYTDIAIGTARTLGFKLSKNFDYPFFSRNVSEFWQKWHISLISWIRDYVLRRLKGFSKIKLYRNIFIVFILTGFWHGANWTFIFWGFLHALTFIPLVFWKRTKYKYTIAHNKFFPSIKESFLMLKTFLIFALVGVFFRIDTVLDGFKYLGKIFSISLFSMPMLPGKSVFIGIVFLLLVEWMQRNKEHGLSLEGLKISPIIRWSFYISIVFIIILFGGSSNDFIYFQF
ncbi:MAG: membrane-bound O-acyltransferase family protein [Lutibacter sp.]|nr:MAG: membrane-bound O-acyltransferase family protein [Lutibacter sp.]